MSVEKIDQKVLTAQLLSQSQSGNREALDRLFPIVYGELRKIAAIQLSDERADHTLQPTALVHEAYLRLISQHSVDWNNRVHFFSIAAEMMRRILVNYAVQKKAQKRGAEVTLISLDDLIESADQENFDLIRFDEIIERLLKFDERQAKIIELRFFGGLTSPQIAEVLKISESTVNREWRCAKAWILSQMRENQT